MFHHHNFGLLTLEPDGARDPRLVYRIYGRDDHESPVELQQTLELE